MINTENIVRFSQPRHQVAQVYDEASVESSWSLRSRREDAISPTRAAIAVSTLSIEAVLQNFVLPATSFLSTMLEDTLYFVPGHLGKCNGENAESTARSRVKENKLVAFKKFLHFYHREILTDIRKA
jgi:hypothetical protein